MTVIAGFYKGQKGKVDSEGRWYHSPNSTMNNICSSPSFYVKLEDGKKLHIQQNKLFVDRKEEKTTISCYLVNKEEKKEYKPCKICVKPKEPEVKPKEEKKPSTCVQAIEQEAEKCKDINCKMELVVKLRQCPDYN